MIRIIISILISFFLLSCSSEDNNQQTQQATEKHKIETAKERALARWNALIEKDWAKAYAFESPNYRKNYSKREFINSFGQAVTWVAIKHLSTHPINPTLTTIKLELTFNYDMGRELIKIPSRIEERWQLIDNKWWHVKK